MIDWLVSHGFVADQIITKWKLIEFIPSNPEVQYIILMKW